MKNNAHYPHPAPFFGRTPPLFKWHPPFSQTPSPVIAILELLEWKIIILIKIFDCHCKRSQWRPQIYNVAKRLYQQTIAIQCNHGAFRIDFSNQITSPNFIGMWDKYYEASNCWFYIKNHVKWTWAKHHIKRRRLKWLQLELEDGPNIKINTS